MPSLLIFAGGAISALIVKGQLDDTFGGAPSPLKPVGVVVWSLAAFGAVQLVKRFR